MNIRIILAALFAFLICVITGPIMIAFLRQLKFGQHIREEGPKGHLKKAGTPTMGGIMIILALSLGSLFFSRHDLSLYLLVFVTIGFGLLGFIDDFMKVVMKRNLGLNAKQKFMGQVIIATILAVFVSMHPQLGTEILIPVWGQKINLGLFYIPFVVFVLVGTSNAVNLTDGLDGLAAGTMAIAITCYLFICIALGRLELAVFCAATAGACLGFLWFNAHPAQVFMGDTGSLALGGALSALAVLTKTEILLIVIGGVFVIETLSVIIQVLCFKTTGKRIFRMSPIHHHFELKGWSETKVVIRFWIVAAILGGVSLILM